MRVMATRRQKIQEWTDSAESLAEILLSVEPFVCQSESGTLPIAPHMFPLS